MAGAFLGKGMLISGILHLSPREAYEAIQEGALLVDVREKHLKDYKAFDVPNQILLPFSSFQDSVSELPRDKPLILADSLGLRSKEALQFLKDRGFENIANLNGGISAWEDSGLPLRKDPAAELSGACACRLRPPSK